MSGGTRGARPARWIAALLALGLAGCPRPPAPVPEGPITEASRDRALREAEVWHPVDTAQLDVRTGPPGSRDPDAPLDCSFVVPPVPPGGNTPRFSCRLADGRILDVKYGPANLAVHGEIFGARLLWLLGFYSDRVDPARVHCRGCPADPWGYLQKIDAAEPHPAPPPGPLRVFSPAIVETRFGERIEAWRGQGLAWPEILSELSEDPARARTQRVRREALTLLAVFLGHADSRAGSQTLACHPEGGGAVRCRRSVVYIGDLGGILGGGGRPSVSKVDVEKWANLPVWRDAEGCVARVRTHREGTLRDTPISEPARAFLAERLAATRDDQIRTLFELAGLDGVGGEVEEADGAHPPAADDWLRVFRAKQREIAGRRCPEAP